MAANSDFAARLASWRKRRGLSQLALALAADCSQRHIAFLERGRAQPSRAMVARLVEALGVPMRDANALLLAAGFAPIWPEAPLDAETMGPVREALARMLAQQEPFPAVVVDRRWNLLLANKGMGSLVEFLLGPIAPGAQVNLADALVGPDVLRPHLANWAEVVRHFLRTVEADAALDGSAETAALRNRLLGYPDVRVVLAEPVERVPDAPVLPMRFRKAGVEIALFTTIATLGTPSDVTLQELRIEAFFPMDDATRCVFESWRKPSTSG